MKSRRGKGNPNYKHGCNKTPEYYSWTNMKQQCKNPKYRDFYRYGGRGIKICDSWDTFQNFLEDMGKKPGKEYTIDRINNDGDYTPENCRWATKLQQSGNTKSSNPVPGVSFLRSKKTWIVHFKNQRMGSSPSYHFAVLIRKAVEHDSAL